MTPSKPRIGIYPGTFDPITKGHLHIIKRASRQVDRLIVGVAENIRKSPRFDIEARLAMVKTDCESLPEKYCEIEVRPFDNLLVHFAREMNASCIFRGLRAVSDFDVALDRAAQAVEEAKRIGSRRGRIGGAPQQQRRQRDLGGIVERPAVEHLEEIEQRAVRRREGLFATSRRETVPQQRLEHVVIAP